MNQLPAHGLSQSLGLQIAGADRAPVAADHDAPRPGRGGFADLLRAATGTDTPTSAGGSTLPSVGTELPVAPPAEPASLPPQDRSGVLLNGPMNRRLQPAASMPGDSGEPTAAPDLELYRLVSGPALTDAARPVSSAMQASNPNHGRVERLTLLHDQTHMWRSQTELAVPIRPAIKPQAIMSAAASSAIPAGELHVESQPTAERSAILHAVLRGRGPRQSTDGGLRPESVALRTTNSPVPIGLTAPEAAVRPVLTPETLMSAVRGEASDAIELPDLPFETIRITVRDGPGERPGASRPPALELPAPRLPVGHPDWGRALGERLVVMVRGEHQVARLSLNPEHLGPVDIQLQITEDQARLWFTAQHAQTREALEAAVPRLREMFAQQGLDLSQNTGRDDGPGRGGEDGRATAGHRHDAGESGSDPTAADRPRDGEGGIRRGLVDDFA